MKTCFLITTYCDTDIKVNSLRDTIDRIKKYGHDIVMYNHYPIPTDIQSEVNFSIYDKSNPVITDMTDRSMIYWTRIRRTPYSLTRIMPDYGYAVVQQWKRSIQFVHNMGYERVYVINYDTKFSDEFFKKAQTHLVDNTCFAIEYGEESLYLAFFAANLTYDFVKRFDVINFNHYIQTVGEGISEHYIYSLIFDYLSNIHNFYEFSNEDITTDITIAAIDNVYIDNDYSVSAGAEKFVFGHETPSYDKLVVLLYDIRTDLNFIIEYDDSKILETVIKKELDYIYNHIPLKRSTIDYTKLKFLINGVEIKKLNELAQHVTIETLYQTI